jgi:DNA topoisomerase-1
MFINVPKRYDFAALSAAEMNELIEAKIKKEENRYIQRWPDLNIALENGRWGPVIRFGKKQLYLPKKADGARYSPEEGAAFSLDQIKAFIEQQIPGAFSKKTKASKAPAKKGAKKAPVKKAVSKKTPATKSKATPTKKKTGKK